MKQLLCQKSKLGHYTLYKMPVRQRALADNFDGVVKNDAGMTKNDAGMTKKWLFSKGSTLISLLSDLYLSPIFTHPVRSASTPLVRGDLENYLDELTSQAQKIRDVFTFSSSHIRAFAPLR